MDYFMDSEHFFTLLLIIPFTPQAQSIAEIYSLTPINKGFYY